MFAGAYAGATVFLTGHTGFKGAWLALWLRRLGATVVGYALAPPTEPSIFAAGRLHELIEHIEGDIRDEARVRAALERHRPSVVFHLAASPLVRDSYGAPRETFDVNVMGTISVLEAVRATRHPCAVVAVSTDKCYENQEWEFGYRESDPMGGHDPYSASKGAMEIAVASWRRSFFSGGAPGAVAVRLASARAGNVIGGGDWAKDRIVPDIVRALAQGVPVEVRNPGAIRPWQHVLEPLSGYLWLGARLGMSDDPALASGWNFGPRPTEHFTVADVVSTLIDAWGDGSWHTPAAAVQPHEAGILRLAIDKAQVRLGWSPVWRFDETVRRTADWYRHVLDASLAATAVRDACDADIAAYEHAACRHALAWAT